MHFAQRQRQSAVTESAPSLQRSAAPAAHANRSAPTAYRHAPRSAGESVRHGYFGTGVAPEPRVRSRVEAATGSDLSGARLHTGESAQMMAESVSARAFTVGRDVHFAPGEYRPGSAEGDRLIAHELVHVAQQGARAVMPGTELSVGDEHGASEHAAESIANSRDGASAGGEHVAHRDPYVARAPAVETKEVQGIQLTEAKIAEAHGEGYWYALLSSVYTVERFDLRWDTDHEERDAIGAEAWVEHLKAQPLTSTVNIVRVLPPRVPGTKPVMYRLQFEPAPRGRGAAAKPTLRFLFLGEGAQAAAEHATSPASAPKVPSSLSEAEFPAGGFNAFMAAFPDEAQQLFNWINTMAPAGNFSRVVRTSTPSSGHETSMLLTGTKRGAVVSTVLIRFLAFSAPTGMGKPGWYSYRFGYREKDRTDFELEQLQSRKTDTLGSITGVDTLPFEERPAVNYAIYQYFEGGTRNAEVDAIVPIPGGKRNMLYKLRFEPRTNNVRVRSIGEEGKDVVLDPAKRKLDVRRVRGFDPNASVPTLKSWISNRYKGLAPTGNTSAEVVTNTNAKIDAEAGATEWFAKNYAMPVLNAREGGARLKTVGLHDQQRANMKPYQPPELRLMEIALELLSDAVLDVARGTALTRQAVDIDRKFVPASGGKAAHWKYSPIPTTAGQTWARAGGGGDRTIVMYDQMSASDHSLFAGDRTSSGQVDAVSFGAQMVVHEFGHVAAAAGGTLAEFNTKFADKRSQVHAAPVTSYAAKDPAGEFFPEAFAIYNTDPKWMLDNIPAMHAWFQLLSTKGSMP